MTTNHRPLFTIASIAALLLTVPLAGRTWAQDAPRVALEFTPGVLSFPDDGVVNERLLAGSARFYVTPRLSLGPEISHVQGGNHSHVIATGNITFDFLGPINGKPPRVTPFVVGGLGIFQTREEFFNGPYRSSDPAFTAGGGVRAHVGERLIIGGEARIGWELHLRVNAIVGVRF